jgi:hypothetical protein
MASPMTARITTIPQITAAMDCSRWILYVFDYA